MNDIYCEIGKSKKAILSIDGKLIHFKIHFDDENPFVYFSFDNFDDVKHCDCELGKIAHANQVKTMLIGRMAGNENSIIPQIYCGYCSKKYPPKQECVIQLIDYEEIDAETKNGKSNSNRQKN